MKEVAVEQLSDQMSQLVADTRGGEEVLFTQGNVPVAKLVSIAPHKASRTAGSAKHLPHFMSPDFDAIPEGFEEYLP
jgi:antitoxin (DNA-binding transcriptional repressor) of toxin-antitoxin stability system